MDRLQNERGQFAREERDFEVTVWDWEGNIVKKLWHATEAELNEVEETYGDGPLFTIDVQENQRWDG